MTVSNVSLIRIARFRSAMMLIIRERELFLREKFDRFVESSAALRK